MNLQVALILLHEMEDYHWSPVNFLVKANAEGGLLSNEYDYR
jgi:hypothetical protein